MTKKGEMTVDEIRNLVRQHNKLTHIDPGLSRAKLISAIERSGYAINHKAKKIVVKSQKAKIGATNLKSISQAKSGEVKPQKKTVKKQKRKALIAGGGGGDIFSQMFNDPLEKEYV
jgi:glycerol dehydrogenase-like iron-containing ADH family enzyme